jgi:hypothetical protein
MKTFEFDFENVLIQIINAANKEYNLLAKQLIGSDITSAEAQALVCLIEERYLRSINISATYLKKYHESLMQYFENQDAKNR